jgi:hypothetical protein
LGKIIERGRIPAGFNSNHVSGVATSHKRAHGSGSLRWHGADLKVGRRLADDSRRVVVSA